MQYQFNDFLKSINVVPIKETKIKVDSERNVIDHKLTLLEKKLNIDTRNMEDKQNEA